MSSSPDNQILGEDQLNALIDAEIARLCDFRTRMDRRTRFAVNFKHIQKLGRGAEGNVSSMLHSPTNTVFAVKQLAQHRHPHSAAVPTAHNEVRILSLLMNVGAGPGLSTICQPAMHEAWYPSTPGPDRQCIVLEYCEMGSLHDYLAADCFQDAPADGSRRATWRVPHEGLLRHLYTQLLEGLAFLHYAYGTTAFDARKRAPVGRKPIVHRDIKPDNVLVCPAKPGCHPSLVTLKIGDFGGAAEVADAPRSRDDDRGLYFFTRGYVAPEFLTHGVSRSGANLASDVFAAGATAYYCVYGREPFRRDPVDGTTRFARTNMANQRHRKDALTILEKLRRNDARYRRQFVSWMERVEGPRAERERAGEAGRDRRAQEAREREAREAMRVQLPMRCSDPACHDALLPHSHDCRAVDVCFLASIDNHSHMLYGLYGTWADPRTHLPDDLYAVPLEDMKWALDLIGLKAQAFQLLQSEKNVDEIMRDIDALMAEAPGPAVPPAW